MRPGHALSRISRRTLYLLLLSAVVSADTFAASAPSSTQPASAPAAREATSSNAGDLDDISLLTMEVPVVITASRREQKITTVPNAMSVITAEDIRASGVQSVPEALRLVPGVDVAQLSSNTWAISPRGLHGVLSRETLVLVDGRQIFDSFFGGTLWGAWPFQLEDIARIEVVRGPAGVTWGANAVNGVINIITKDPADQLGLTTTGGGGSRGWQKEHLGYAFQDGKLRMRVSGEYEGNDGFRKGGSILRRNDDDLDQGRMNIHAIYDAGPKDTLTLSGGSTVVDGGYSAPPLASLTANPSATSQGSFIQGTWEHRIASDNRISLNGFVNDAYEVAATTVLKYRYQQLGLQLTHTFSPAENHTFTWGVDTRTDLLDTSHAEPYQTTRDFMSTAILGVYAQDEWRFAPRWRLNLGARIDYEFYGGWQPSGRTALSYDLNDTSMVYAAVSRAFQMPPVGGRFANTPLLHGLVHATADQDVRPETLIAYELGYRSRFFDKLRTDLNVFWHEYDDLTIFGLQPGPPGLVRYEFDNAFGGSVYGVEADAEYAVNKHLALLGNYTFESLIENGPAGLSQTDVMSPPRHKFMVGARYSPLADLHLSAHLYFVDSLNAPNPTFPLIRLNVPHYFRLDLRSEYEFWKDRGSIAVGVRNLLDPDHFEGASQFENAGEVPRMVYAEMRMHFK